MDSNRPPSTFTTRAEQLEDARRRGLPTPKMIPGVKDYPAGSIEALMQQTIERAKAKVKGQQARTNDYPGMTDTQSTSEVTSLAKAAETLRQHVLERNLDKPFAGDNRRKYVNPEVSHALSPTNVALLDAQPHLQNISTDTSGTSQFGASQPYIPNPCLSSLSRAHNESLSSSTFTMSIASHQQRCASEPRLHTSLNPSSPDKAIPAVEEDTPMDSIGEDHEMEDEVAASSSRQIYDETHPNWAGPKETEEDKKLWDQFLKAIEPKPETQREQWNPNLDPAPEHIHNSFLAFMYDDQEPGFNNETHLNETQKKLRVGIREQLQRPWVHDALAAYTPAADEEYEEFYRDPFGAETEQHENRLRNQDLEVVPVVGTEDRDLAQAYRGLPENKSERRDWIPFSPMGAVATEGYGSSVHGNKDHNGRSESPAQADSHGGSLSPIVDVVNTHHVQEGLEGPLNESENDDFPQVDGLSHDEHDSTANSNTDDDVSIQNKQKKRAAIVRDSQLALSDGQWDEHQGRQFDENHDDALSVGAVDENPIKHAADKRPGVHMSRANEALVAGENGESIFDDDDDDDTSVQDGVLDISRYVELPVIMTPDLEGFQDGYFSQLFLQRRLLDILEYETDKGRHQDAETQRLRDILLKTVQREIAGKNLHRVHKPRFKARQSEAAWVDRRDTALGKLMEGMERGQDASSTRDVCSFCCHPKVYGVGDREVLLPPEASAGFCQDCEDSCNKLNEVVQSYEHKLAEDLRDPLPNPLRVLATQGKYADLALTYLSPEEQAEYRKKARAKGYKGSSIQDYFDIQSYVKQGVLVPFCRSATSYGKVDVTKAKICDSCLSLKFYISQHTAHRQFSPIETHPDKGSADWQAGQKLADRIGKSCMICLQLAVVCCHGCNLRICNNCEIDLTRMFKGNIYEMIKAQPREHRRNDAFLLGNPNPSRDVINLEDET